MRTRFKFLVCGVLAALLGCSEGGPVEIGAHDGPALRVSGLGESYAWAQSADASAPNAEVHALLMNAIDRELQRKGFRKADGGPSDFLVEYRVTKEDKSDFSVNPHGVTYPSGTLLVRLIDPPTQRSIWVGSATARILANAPPAERQKRVEDGIRRMLSRMPPK
jgi:hypothetical protein